MGVYCIVYCKAHNEWADMDKFEPNLKPEDKWGEDMLAKYKRFIAKHKDCNITIGYDGMMNTEEENKEICDIEDNGIKFEEGK
jgi:hypothetical protein